MNLSEGTKGTIRHTLHILAAFAIGALGAQVGQGGVDRAPTPEVRMTTPSTLPAPLGTRIQNLVNRVDPDAEVIWDGKGQRYLVEMKRPILTEEDPRWDCARMGNRICGNQDPPS